MPIATTFAGDSARAEGLFSSVISISQSYWSAILNIGTLANVGKGVTVDGSGNIYVCGSFQPASAQTIGFVAKYNSSGVVQWQRSLSDLQAAPATVSNGITVDSSGNVYVAGVGLHGSGGGTTCLLVYKLDSSGTIQWQYTMVDSANYSSSLVNFGITIDNSNNLYVVGTAVYGAGVIGCSIYKLNSSGTLQWQKILNDSSTGKVRFDSFNGVAVDGSGNVYAAGRTTDSSTGLIILQIAKYNSSGALQWQRIVTDTNNYGGESASGVAVDGSGNVYIVGVINDNSTYKTLIVKYNSSGTVQWNRTLTNDVGGTTQTGDGIIIDSSNYVYVIGNGTYSGTKSGMSVSKWDSSGTIQWQRVFASSNTSPTSVGNFITTDNLGNLYFGGYISNNSNVVSTSISKLPIDGSKTGSYTGTTFKFDYFATTWIAASSTAFVSSTSSNTDGTSTMTNSSSSFTATTQTGTTETITV